MLGVRTRRLVLVVTTFFLPLPARDGMLHSPHT